MVKEVSVHELQTLLNSDQEYILIDVRQPWEFNICHLLNSINVPLENVISLTVPEDKNIITICHHGVRSKQAAILLEQGGYVNVMSLQGGVDAWAREIDLTMERY